ncbi:lactate/malate family dehydrogenase [Streptomyces sp. NPDC004166]
MKVGVVGVGAVGAATALSLVERGGTCREIVLIDRNTPRADGVAADMRYATPLSPTVDIRSGRYEDLAHAAVVVITAGTNEKARRCHRPVRPGGTAAAAGLQCEGVRRHRPAGGRGRTAGGAHGGHRPTGPTGRPHP